MIPTTPKRASFDMMAEPPAGMSLTTENSKYPWGNPPKYSDPDEALTKALDGLEEGSNKDNLLKLLISGVSVESLVEGYIYEGFESGRFSVDTGMLIKAPLSLTIANIAEENKVPYRFFENENQMTEDQISDENVLRLMKTNNPEMYDFLLTSTGELSRLGTMTKKPDISKGFIDAGEVKW